MKDLTIHRNLNDNTRKQGIWVQTPNGVEVFSLHIKNNEVIITANSDYTKIYVIYSLEYYNTCILKSPIDQIL